MKPAFVDTSFYVAFVNPRDALHAAARRLSREIRGQVITTEYVLVEVGNWLSRSGDKPLFVKLLTDVQADPGTTIVPANHDLFVRGNALFAQRLDKDWSLTDCISFTVMRQLGLADALTADHHFEQAGYRILLPG